MKKISGSNREAKKKHTHEISRNLAKDSAGGFQTPGCCFKYLEHLIFLGVVLARLAKNGGKGEIRTRECLATLLAFQASGFNHSPTFPLDCLRKITGLNSCYKWHLK